MPKGILVVFSEPTTPGDDDRYNEWYTGQHLPDLIDMPMVSAAARYKLVPGVEFPGGTSSTLPDQQYLAIYYVETDDPESFSAEITKRIEDGTMSLEDSKLQAAPLPSAAFFTEITSQP